MGWVCTNCSTSNEDSESCCAVCGAERPTRGEIAERESEELKVVFSDFDAFKESVKSFFARLSSVKREKKPRTKKAKPKKSESVVSKPAKEKKPKKAKKPLFGSPFATPWPEHKVKFDTSVIESKGFVRSERESLNGVNGYRFYKADDSSQFIRIEMAIIQKLANKV